RGEVAGVDVGDRGHERRAEEGQRAADAPARAHALANERLGDGCFLRAHGASTRCSRSELAVESAPADSTRSARASAPPRTWTVAASPKRTNSGPSNGCL